MISGKIYKHKKKDLIIILTCYQCPSSIFKSMGTIIKSKDEDIIGTHVPIINSDYKEFKGSIKLTQK